MTGRDRGTAAGAPDRLARATVETAHADPATVAAALRPDNTDEMDTVLVEAGDAGEDGAGSRDDQATGDDAGDDQATGDDAGDDQATGDDAGGDQATDNCDDERHRRVRTTIERTTASGLRSTVDDYLVNLDVADRTVRHTRDHTTRQ